jgi:hypothetical protein
VDIVQFAVGDVDEPSNVAAQVEQRVHLCRGFGRVEVRKSASVVAFGEPIIQFAGQQ